LGWRLKLGKRTRQLILDARPYHDGRRILARVASKKDVSDIKEMIMIKARPKKR